jgi:hypothetical protein
VTRREAERVVDVVAWCLLGMALLALFAGVLQ